MNQGDEKEMNARETLLAAPLADLDDPSLIRELYYMADRHGELYHHDRLFYVQDNKEETDRRVARALERASRLDEAAAVVAYAIVEVRFLEGDETDIPSTRRLFGAMRGVRGMRVPLDIASRWSEKHPWVFLWSFVSGLWRTNADIPLYGSDPPSPPPPLSPVSGDEHNE